MEDNIILRAKRIGLYNSNISDERKRNSYLNCEEIVEKKEVLKSYPRRIVLELSTFCNQKCIMCNRENIITNPKKLSISPECFSDLITYSEEIAYIGWGEATLHPKLTEYIEYFLSSGIRQYLVTNGMRYVKSMEKLDIIAFSVDGLKETHNRIRVGSDLNKIILNIKKMKTLNPELYINFVFTAMRQNIHELPDVIMLAAGLGVQEVKVVYLTVFDKSLLSESLFDESNLVNEVFNTAKSIANDNLVRLKLPHIKGKDPAGDKPHKTCYMPWRDIIIGADGFIRPCHNHTGIIPCSNLDNFMKIWNHKNLMTVRKVVNTNQMDDICKQCCQSSCANWNQKHAWIRV